MLKAKCPKGKEAHHVQGNSKLTGPVDVLARGKQEEATKEKLVSFCMLIKVIPLIS